MNRAGWILAGIMFVVFGLTYFSFIPDEVKCLLASVGLFVAIMGGFLAGQVAHPPTANGARQVGARAGALGGIGALLAEVVGGMTWAAILGREGGADLAQSTFGLKIDTTGSPFFHYAGALGATCCVGLFLVALLAGLGALGGLLWWQIAGKKSGAQEPM